MYEGQLYVVSGPSGAGKGSICRVLLDETDISLSISVTTRIPRPEEKDGVNYYFVTRDEFERMIDEGGFFEYAEVYGNYYGTPMQAVIDRLRDGADVILEIESKGAFQIKARYPDVILIFVLPPSLAELRHRLTGRGSETEDVIDLRMSETIREIEQIEEYDYYVVNRDISEAVARIKAIIAAEHSRVPKDVRSIIERYKGEK